MSGTAVVKGYVKGVIERHFAGEMEFDLPYSWPTMGPYAQGLWINERKKELKKYLFEIDVEINDEDE